MGQLFNRNVLLGVTGGIAAYKSAQLVRDLREAGALVRVVMTQGATEFITPLTLQTLSGNPVHQELLTKNGIYMMEVVKTDQLAKDRVYEFAFSFAPIRAEGATGSPAHPFAII